MKDLFRPSDRENQCSEDMILRHKNGGLIDAALSLTPHIEPVDEYTGFSSIVSDLQPRREAEKAQQMARDLELRQSIGT